MYIRGDGSGRDVAFRSVLISDTEGGDDMHTGSSHP